MDCLMAKCPRIIYTLCDQADTRIGIPTITDCVLAELEKLGPKYRLALRIAKDPRFERLHCDRKSAS